MNRQRWAMLSLSEQLGNIGSELSRLRHWEATHAQQHRMRAAQRALELIDLTRASSGHTTERQRELARFSEVVRDWVAGGHQYHVPPQAIQEYCLRFGVLARRTKKR